MPLDDLEADVDHPRRHLGAATAREDQSAARVPMPAPSTCTVVSDGSRCAAKSASPKPQTARSSGTRRPRAWASVSTPLREAVRAAVHGPQLRVLLAAVRPARAGPSAMLLGAGTTAVGTSRPTADRKPSRRSEARWSSPVAMPSRLPALAEEVAGDRAAHLHVREADQHVDRPVAQVPGLDHRNADAPQPFRCCVRLQQARDDDAVDADG